MIGSMTSSGDNPGHFSSMADRVTTWVAEPAYERTSHDYSGKVGMPVIDTCVWQADHDSFASSDAMGRCHI
jgi:hypothetical protein